MNDLLSIFEEERTCEYRGEIYRVRDNGAICRQINPEKRKRKLDEIWSFGIINNQKKYLGFSSEAVHRIVATAFHGEQPSKSHVVDHVDTNKQNNRPENLRWVTRLENIFLNPITLSRIIYKFGSVDNFFSNPSQPLNGQLEQSYDWMRTVTKEEAENTKQNLMKWAEEGSLPKGGELGEWVFSKLNHVENHDEKEHDEKENEYIQEDTIVQSLTSNAIQINWKTPSEFPNCPDSIEGDALVKYKEKLIKGAVFSKNQYGESIVEDSDINEGLKDLFVITETKNVTSYALAKIYIKKNVFVHETIRSFLTLIGAQKQFSLALGREWDEEDSIDDYS